MRFHRFCVSLALLLQLQTTRRCVGQELYDCTGFDVLMDFFVSPVEPLRTSSVQVPSAVRTLYQQYGLCSDEFQAFGYLPPQLYVRISNRLVGDTVVTQNTIAAPRNKPDSIGVGDWSFDVSASQ